MSFIRIFTITFITQIIIVLSGILNNIIIVRRLGPEGQGIYTLIITTSVMLLILGNAGLTMSNNYWVRKNKEEASTIFANSLFFAIGISLIIFLSYILFGKRIMLIFFSPDISLLLAISLPFLLIQEFNQGILWGLERYDYHNFLNIFRSASLVGANLILILILKLGIKAAVLGWLLTISLSSIVSIFIIWREIGITYILPKISLLIKSLGTGFKVLICDITWFLSTRIDLYLVAYFLGVKEVGFYSIAILIIQMAIILPTILGKFIFNSSIVNDQKQTLFAVNLIKMTLIYSLIFALAIILLGRITIEIFFGKVFIRSFECLIFLLPAAIAQSLAISIGRFINGIKAIPGQMVFLAVITLILNIAFNLFLIPKLGINGAAISSSLSSIIQLGLLFIILKSFNLKLKINHIFNFSFKDSINYIRQQ